MRCSVALVFLSVSLVFAQGPDHRENTMARARDRASVPGYDRATHFVLWEKKDNLRRRTGTPKQYFVPRIQKIIRPGELKYYLDTYKKVDDVFYRQTSHGEIRILVAYAVDGSRSHLNPDIRVFKVHFVFDKDLTLRDALSDIDELRDLCSGGCILNGFSSSVIVQPAEPSEAQIVLAREMKPQWRGQDMSDATPGAEVFYQDSPYPIDFEHSPVERIDLTLVSNAGKEKYIMSIMNMRATVLDVWRPHGHRAGNTPH
jgi:hypothetical protein